MRKPRVLIFDDEVIVLGLLGRYFRRLGYEVFSYRDPAVCPLNEHSAESCESLAPCADLVISDFRMPKMTGAELLQRQLQRGCRVDMKMKALMSEYPDEEVAAECESLGCKSLAKPFIASELPRWLSERRKHFDLSQQLDGRNRRSRSDYRQYVEYCLDAAGSYKKFSGFTMNKSDDGLGLRVFNPLRAGQNITIMNGMEVPPVNGTVMWCSKEDENTYRAGLRVAKNNSFRIPPSRPAAALAFAAEG